MPTTSIEPSAAEATPASARDGVVPSGPAEPRTTEVAESHNQSPIAGGDVTDSFEQRRRQPAVDAAFLADGFVNLEALVAFQDELHAAYVQALVTHQPAAVWERLLVEHRLVDALREYLEARP